jgi:hypothetical protein
MSYIKGAFLSEPEMLQYHFRGLRIQNNHPYPIEIRHPENPQAELLRQKLSAGEIAPSWISLTGILQSTPEHHELPGPVKDYLYESQNKSSFVYITPLELKRILADSKRGIDTLVPKVLTLSSNPVIIGSVPDSEFSQLSKELMSRVLF